MKGICCPNCQGIVEVENEVKCDKCEKVFTLAIRKYGVKL